MIYVSFCFQVPLSGTAVMVLLCILFLSIRRKAVLLKIIMYVYTHAFFFWTALIHSVIYYSHMSNSQLLLFYSPVSQDWSRNNSSLVLSLIFFFFGSWRWLGEFIQRLSQWVPSGQCGSVLLYWHPNFIQMKFSAVCISDFFSGLL